MIVFVITQHETADSTGFAPDFKTEVWTDGMRAQLRLDQLQADRTPWSGIYYQMEQVRTQS